MDFYNFYMGNEFEAYRYLGAHFAGGTTTFRTFAPKASKIAVIGEFNGWTETPMYKVYDGNFWECVIPHTQEGQMYKYRIYKADGTYIDHADPYAFYSELRPGNASRIVKLNTAAFHDKRWLNSRGDKKTLLAVFNYSDKETEYTMSLGDIMELSLIIDTDDQRFGGQSIPDKAVTVKNGKAVVLLQPFSGRLYAVKSL